MALQERYNRDTCVNDSPVFIDSAVVARVRPDAGMQVYRGELILVY